MTYPSLDSSTETDCDDSKYSWRELITDHLEEYELSFDDLIAITLTDDELDARFDCGYGLPEGKPFTAWTNERVLFPVRYDGSEWVESAPRNPCEEATHHVGG